MERAAAGLRGLGFVLVGMSPGRVPAYFSDVIGACARASPSRADPFEALRRASLPGCASGGAAVRRRECACAPRRSCVACGGQPAPVWQSVARGVRGPAWLLVESRDPIVSVHARPVAWRWVLPAYQKRTWARSMSAFAGVSPSPFSSRVPSSATVALSDAFQRSPVRRVRCPPSLSESPPKGVSVPHP